MLSRNKKNFIPFLMAGFPDLKTSQALALCLLQEGVEVIEIGVPFSDPLADGPMIQKASAVALKNGATLLKTLELIAGLKSQFPSAQVVLFTYLNPLLQFGLERFAKEAVDFGVSATLTVDLPPEEALVYLELHRQAHLKTVFLASPTTSTARLKLIAEASSGFIYYVSRAGVTGEQGHLSASLIDELKRVRQLTDHPLAVGFGISTPEQAAVVAQQADAVVVGSRLLKMIDESANVEMAEMRLSQFACLCQAAIKEGS